jgi:2-desacetyl-2-hydroxyethyl bacteriochlorophyllide A dehydrogenase
VPAVSPDPSPPPSPTDARAVWTTGPEQGALRRQPLPAPGPGDVRVETLWSGISRGTESLVWTGRVPESQYAAMRAPFQEGDFPFPVKYGYAAVGRVVDGPEDVRGRCVFCLHPHQDTFVVPADRVAPLPDGLPPARAVLAANMETAVNALWDAGPRVGDRIVVIGAGTVGCLVARLAAGIPGTDVTLVDVDPDRRTIAEALGCYFAAPADAPGEADLVIHASGHPDGLTTALRLAGIEATVVEMSWYGDRPVPVPLGEAFHSRRLTLLSSQVGMVSPARRARRGYAERMATALALLADPVFDRLITGESPFDTLPETMAALAADGRGVLTHRISYPAAGNLAADTPAAEKGA